MVEVAGEELVQRRGREREREIGSDAGKSSPGRHRVGEGASGGRVGERSPFASF